MYAIESTIVLTGPMKITRVVNLLTRILFFKNYLIILNIHRHSFLKEMFWEILDYPRHQQENCNLLTNYSGHLTSETIICNHNVQLASKKVVLVSVPTNHTIWLSFNSYLNLRNQMLKVWFFGTPIFISCLTQLFIIYLYQKPFIKKCFCTDLWRTLLDEPSHFVS
jgi:hypothetical protein